MTHIANELKQPQSAGRPPRRKESDDK
jgi:hypothetical protein